MVSSMSMCTTPIFQVTVQCKPLNFSHFISHTFEGDKNH